MMRSVIAQVDPQVDRRLNSERCSTGSEEKNTAQPEIPNVGEKPGLFQETPQRSLEVWLL